MNMCKNNTSNTFKVDVKIKGEMSRITFEIFVVIFQKKELD